MIAMWHPATFAPAGSVYSQNQAQAGRGSRTMNPPQYPVLSSQPVGVASAGQGPVPAALPPRPGSAWGHASSPAIYAPAALNRPVPRQHPGRGLVYGAQPGFSIKGATTAESGPACAAIPARGPWAPY